MPNRADAAIICGEVFLSAFRELTRMLSLEYGIMLMDGMIDYLKAVRADAHGSLDSMPVRVAAPFAITLLHVTMGTPLFITDTLMDLWSQSDGTVAECSRCGYRHPASVHACLVCGGRTGEGGCWAKTRARLAGMN